MDKKTEDKWARVIIWCIAAAGVYFVIAYRLQERTPQETSNRQVWNLMGQEAIKAKLTDPDSAIFRHVYFNEVDGIPVTCVRSTPAITLGPTEDFSSSWRAAIRWLTLKRRSAPGSLIRFGRSCVVGEPYHLKG